jgi:CubicO group peptidase (beta-lactamase class C family)
MKVKNLITSVLCSLLLTSCAQPAASPAPTPTDTLIAPATELSQRVQRVESGLIPVTEDGEIRWGTREGIAERMAFYHVPGVGIAVINDYEIEWAKGYGVLEAGGDEPVTPDTLFNAGSILKPVSAAAALTLVERGLLGLDEDVNDKLTSWHIPENEYTAEEKATLRRLLSHSAGLTDGFTDRSTGDPEPEYVAPAGEAPAVTIQQLLDAEPGVDVDGVTRVTMVPGTKFRYANADYAILALLVVDVTQKPFSEFMQETVLGPLGMTSSTYEQPLPEELRGRATTEHYVNGQPFDGKRHHYPIGGLWTTPSDLAHFAIEIMLAYKGQSDKVLSQEMAEEMLTPQIDTPDHPFGDSYGLGFHLAGGDQSLRFVHTGGTWGSTCLLWAYPEPGQGAAIMTNSASGQGAILFEILLSIAAEYGWPMAAPSR